MKSLSYLKKSLDLLSYFRVATPKRHPHKSDARDGTPALTFSYSVTSMLVFLFILIRFTSMLGALFQDFRKLRIKLQYEEIKDRKRWILFL